MKTKMKIFNTIFFAILCALPATVHATEECPFFSPALALCSVHAYNVGDAQNPTDVGRASEIEEVIGMKTTVMVQQLKQQYDELNAVIKRFKTQLNKAVLTSKIEVLTGNTSSSTGSSSGGYNSNNGVSISGASDCSNDDDADKTAQCLQRNIAQIINAANSGKVSDARKQLSNDMSIAIRWNLCTDIIKSKPNDGEFACCQNRQVNQINNLSRASDIVNCANDFRAAISQTVKYNNNKNRSYGWGPYGNR